MMTPNPGKNAGERIGRPPRQIRMFKSETFSVSVICPKCSTANHLTATQLPGYSAVSCSHCGTELGLWSDILARTPPARSPSK